MDLNQDQKSFSSNVIGVHLSSNHHIHFTKAELVDTIENARKCDVLHHLREWLGDTVLEGLCCTHGWVPLSLKIQEEGTFGRFGTAHPKKANYSLQNLP